MPVKNPTKPCSVEGCDKIEWERTWCTMHYYRWYKFGDVNVKIQARRPPSTAPCPINGCGRKVKSLGLCAKHCSKTQRTARGLGLCPSCVWRPAVSATPFTPRRVRDRVTGELGWAVDQTGYHRYRVDWDNPTPHQDVAMPRIPSMFFEWAASGDQEGTSG